MEWSEGSGIEWSGVDERHIAFSGFNEILINISPGSEYQFVSYNKENI